MLQRTCKKISIDFLILDFLNHVIHNNVHWCFSFLGVSWVCLFLYQGVDFSYSSHSSSIYIWGCNFCVGQMRSLIWMCLNNTIDFCQMRSLIWMCLNNTIDFCIFHFVFLLWQFCKLAFFTWLNRIWSIGYTSIPTFFIFFRNVEFRTFTWTATFAFTGVSSE